ncbi:sigma factor G inhibitor Gin [Clostridium sp. WILCCON 0269]|uniref:Sigma factor G inhibitor Gin n=1 Tax=Candidatus Clostridium eludens TaxID=3381663 RepID=A0ABW8SIR7_9CLOT
MKKKYCIICGKPLSNGIIVYGRGMCRSCEERLLKLENNLDFYEYYKERIKKTIIHFVIRGEIIHCQNYRF